MVFEYFEIKSHSSVARNPADSVQVLVISNVKKNTRRCMNACGSHVKLLNKLRLCEDDEFAASTQIQALRLIYLERGASAPWLPGPVREVEERSMAGATFWLQALPFFRSIDHVRGAGKLPRNFKRLQRKRLRMIDSGPPWHHPLLLLW